MPRYDYECETCGRREEVSCSMADRQSSIKCPCGADAAQVFDSFPTVFVTDREYVFDKKNCVRQFGHGYGRTPEQQHAQYEKYFGEMRKMNRRAKASGKRGGMQWLGGMPGEMVDSIGLHEKNPEAVISDPVKFLKKTGMYAGD